MSDAPRDLPFPLDTSIVLENETPDEPVGGRPVFPSDEDERIIVPIELSAREFTILASTVDVGRDPAYPDSAAYVWWLWNRIFLAMEFCLEVAQCFEDENEALMQALADAITNNALLQSAIASAISEQGGAVPGKPLTPAQSAKDALPPEVRDEEGVCIDDALWGACLFLVQSGNRAIEDVFQRLEAASNTLETSGIISQAIPAAGQYVGAAVAFADQMGENIAEGYTAAYDEAYENSLACAIFCAAKATCQLTPDMLVTILSDRLPAPEDTIDFGIVMARVGSGVYSGPEIADVAFYVYFSALKFGQQFGEIIGIRPLTDLMGLGADQLMSDNWMTLCPECSTLELRTYQAYGAALGVVETIPFELDEPFDIVVSPGTGYNYDEIWIEYLVGNIIQHYEVIAGTPVESTGEFPWATREVGEAIVNGSVPGYLTDCPQDALTEIGFFNNPGGGSYTLRLTISAP